MKEVIVIAGPNGAGKTTAAADLLPKHLHVAEFVNADEIARGLSPFNPEGAAVAAGRVMLERIHYLVRTRSNFAFETTCASRTHVHTLRRCRAAGYRVTLLFLWLPSADVAVARVAKRIAQGGHSIPKTVIRRRYIGGIRNMVRLFLPLDDVFLAVDNSDNGGAVIAERHNREPIVIHDMFRWRQIEDVANGRTNI